MKITFICLDGHGHVNTCIGLAQKLTHFGHKCSFILPVNWSCNVSSYGFKVFTVNAQGFAANSDPQERLNKFMEARSPAFELTPIEQFEAIRVPRMKSCFDYIKQTNDQYERHLQNLSPDCIFYVSWMTIPCIVKSGIPYVLLYTCNPLLIYGHLDVPPYSSGLTKNHDVTLFSQMRSSFASALTDLRQQLDLYLASERVDQCPEQRIDFTLLNHSPYLNVYVFPRDLDYAEFNLPANNNWIRVEHALRSTISPSTEDLDNLIPKDYKKLIYLTLGSQVSNSNFLIKVISSLTKSVYHFIISLGSLSCESIRLPSNMVGRKYVNQLAILPQTDLVIHHGGNNTFIETLYFGKPSIIFPMFGDQHDNGRRAEDIGIGRCLSPSSWSEEGLLETIDEILEDERMYKKAAEISLNLQKTDSHEHLNVILTKIFEAHSK